MAASRCCLQAVGQFHFARTRFLKQCRVYSLKTKATPYQRRQGLRFDLRLSPRGYKTPLKKKINLTPVDSLLPCSASLPLETFVTYEPPDLSQTIVGKPLDQHILHTETKGKEMRRWGGGAAGTSRKSKHVASFGEMSGASGWIRWDPRTSLISGGSARGDSVKVLRLFLAPARHSLTRCKNVAEPLRIYCTAALPFFFFFFLMPKTFTFQVRYRKCLLFGICPLAATPKWAHPKRRWPKVADCVPFSHKLEINMLMKFTFHMPASRGRWIYLVFLPRGQTGISRRHCHISWQGFNARNSAADGEMEPKFYWVVGSANVALRAIGVIAPCDPAVCHTFFFFF